MSLVSRINDFAASVRDKFNAVAPRLLPGGGSTGQILAKSSAADYDSRWVDAADGAALTDGNKGDILVSNSGTTLTIDPAVKYGTSLAMFQNIYSN